MAMGPLSLSHKLNERTDRWRKGCQQEGIHRGEMKALSPHTIGEVGDQRRVDERGQKPHPDRACREGWLLGDVQV